MFNKKILDKTKKRIAKERRFGNAADEFIKFVVMFNRFINHRHKEKVPFIEKDMRM